MEQAEGTHYEVALQVVEPKFDTERRYVAAELDYVHRQISALDRKWRPVAWPSLGVYRKQDWQKYARELEGYAAALNRHEDEIEGGWLPFKIHVANTGPHDDSDVKVELTAELGTISAKKQAPVRPERLDGGGGGNSSRKRFTLPKYGGFERRGVKIGRHDLSVLFSKLEAGSSADLVRQTLYLHYTDGTKLRFELNSRLVKGLTGEFAA
jgi:hypothetical protein